MLRKWTTMIMMLFMVTGCSLFQGAKPETVNQSFFLAYALVQSGYDSIEIAILGGHIKTQEQARRLKEPIDRSKAALDAARVTFDATGILDDGVFNSTRTALLALQQTLIALGAGDETTSSLGITSEPLGVPI